ncbi:transglycosylase domain-containing protein [Actinocatenispora sera]|uniref:Penicillin-binding protein n=1 Tax=Actinocatenispora sera TaxID=390989 RepID=A0A810KYS4_9ACTN|nr:transglycosylase domain-containing protein [Actinocatenispora sera]BCJ27582.1 penicillin-binding protein [Actinocatenispora sera]
MREHSLLSNAASLLICGLLAGVVVAAAAFPAVAFGGLTAKAGSDSFENLPSDLKIAPSQQISYLYANDGKTLIAQMYDENRKDVPLSQVSKNMQRAIVAAEDTRFYHHHGVDLKGVMRALVANGQSGEVQQGSSTLTMQYVRNVLKSDPNLTPEEQKEALADTPARKLKEMRYAVALEKKLTKKQILERYLNISYFGHGAYGIYAASKTYFSKLPSELTVSEAAMIAGLVQSPDQYDPTKDMKDATARRDYVLGAMAKMGYIGTDTAHKDQKQKIELHVSQAENGCSSVPDKHNDWGFFCDYVQNWWSHQKAFGANPAERVKNLKQGGYKIITSLDPKTQQTAMDQSTSVYAKNSNFALPIAAVEPGTGRVLALAVNRNYSYAKNPKGQNGYPNTVNPLITGTGDSVHDGGYQTGSTYKMFTMLAALADGKPLDTGYVAPVQFKSRYPTAAGDGACSNGNGGYVYCVKNDSDTSYFSGYRNMWTGFGHSVNTYFVWLEQEVGPQKAVAMAKKLGIKFKGDPNQGFTENHGASDAWLSNHADEWGPFTLGVTSTYPLELANAYATIAADGKYCAPLPVMKIINNEGKEVSAGKPNCHQAIPADIARAATDATRCTVNQTPYYGQCSGGTAGAVAGWLGDWQFGGKTGSSQNNATETFAGITTGVAAAGTAVDPTDQRNYVGAVVSNQVDQAVTKTMQTALRHKKPVAFKKESKKIALGDDGSLTQPPPTKKKKDDPKHPGGDDHGGRGHGGHGGGTWPFGETPQSYGPTGRRY